MNSNKKTARIAGFLYLIVAVTGFFSSYVGKNLIVSGDASATANNILSSGWLFRMSLLSALIMTVSWILLAFVLYVLFRPVNKNLVVLMVSFVLAGSAATCITVLCKYGSVMVMNNTGYLTTFKTDQLQALAMLLLDLSGHGLFIAYIFFGLWLFPLGYLVLKSGFIPGILGILLFIAGLGYLGDFFVFALFPGVGVTITNFTFWGEVFLLLWLLIKGVKIPDKQTESVR
jgi:hypothetical protein